MLSIDEILVGVRRIKEEHSAVVRERDTAMLDRDAIKAKLDGVKSLIASDGDSLSLTKLPTFLRNLRELIEDAKS